MQHITADIQAPDEKALKLFYQKNPKTFNQNQQIQIRHIFHTAKPPLLKALQLLEEGKSFKTLARQFSKAPEGDSSRWVTKGNFTIFDKAFALKKKQISPIWQSRYGWHLIQVLDKKAGKALSFKEAKPLIQKIFIHRRKKAEFAKWLDEESKKMPVFKNQKVIDRIKIL